MIEENIKNIKHSIKDDLILFFLIVSSISLSLLGSKLTLRTASINL